ncbi:MAG: hypothetical protein QM674_23980 [Burkholderiaceae bacterium]
MAVSVTPQSGFRCRSLGEWKDLPSTVNALQALHSAAGGLPGLMMQTPSMPARRLVRHAARQYSVMARSEPIPPSAEPITDATRIEADIGGQLLGWAFDSQNWPDRILLSADGALQLISWDALIVQGRRVIDRSIVVNVPTLRALASPAEPTPTLVVEQANRLLAIGTAEGRSNKHAGSSFRPTVTPIGSLPT